MTGVPCTFPDSERSLLERQIRALDASGRDAARSVGWVSHYETGGKCFYGTMPIRFVDKTDF